MNTATIVPPQRSAWRGGLALRVIQSVVWSLLITAFLIFLAGKNPLVAYQHIVLGAFGSIDRIVVGLNKAAPYMLAGVGVALLPRRVAAYGQKGKLRRLHPSMPFFPDTIFLAFRADMHRTRAATRLKDALVAHGKRLGAET